MPRGKPYLAGWAYVLSRDVAEDLVELVAGFAFQPETQPGGFMRTAPRCCLAS